MKYIIKYMKLYLFLIILCTCLLYECLGNNFSSQKKFLEHYRFYLQNGKTDLKGWAWPSFLLFKKHKNRIGNKKLMGNGILEHRQMRLYGNH